VIDNSGIFQFFAVLQNKGSLYFLFAASHHLKPLDEQRL
jgi:hypothetical protein